MPHAHFRTDALGFVAVGTAALAHVGMSTNEIPSVVLIHLVIAPNSE